MEEGGLISIRIEAVKDLIHISITNPYLEENSHHVGNKIALKNIQERLTLHFDLEASLKNNIENHTYQVHIIIPYYEKAIA